MPLFRSKRDKIVEWCAKQYLRRVESIEAQQLFMMASSGGWTAEQQITEFHEVNWPVVVGEASQRFGAEAAAEVRADLLAQEEAIRRGFSWDLGMSRGIEAAIASLRGSSP